MIRPQNDFSCLISAQVNSLTYDQLRFLFDIYLEVNVQFDFFMSEKAHTDFMTFFHQTPSKHRYSTFQSLMNLLATAYTDRSRYPYVLQTIDMIKKDLSLKEIINVLYRYR